MPEKSKNEIPRAIREMYEKGMLNFERQNFDYALTIFGQALQKEPGFYECREALRATQFKKAGGGTGFFRKMLGTASSSALLAKLYTTLRTNPVEAIQAAEQVLNADPTNAQAHQLLAEAALACDLPRTAVLSLEIVFKNAPDDRAVILKLAAALKAAGNLGRAETILSDLLRGDPSDLDVAQALKDLSAHRTLKEGGYDALSDGQGSYRDILKNKEEAVSLEQANREVKSEDVADRLIGEYEARLAREPGQQKLLRSLAELYTQKNQFDRALEYYQKLTAGEGGADPAVERTISEVTARKFDHALAQLDPEAPDHAEQIACLQTERQAYLLGDCQRRVDRYPTDLVLRFELGQMFLQAGRVSEAIGEFQKAQNNPHKRIAAMGCLGQCFAHRRMFDLAARSFQNAIKEKQVFDDEKKELIYALGVVLEQMGRKEDAVEQFKQIYEIDIGYKDVAARVDAYYAAQ